MRRKIILIFIITLLFFQNITAKAETIDCEYKDIDLTMTYDTEKEFDNDSNPFVKKGDYDSNSSPINLFLVKWGKNLNNTDSTEIDQELYKIVKDNYACPTGMQICVYIERAVDMPSLLPDMLDAIFAGDWDKIDGVLNFTSKLVIMTDKEYRDSDYSHYIDRHHYVMGIDFENGFWKNVGDFIKAANGYDGQDLYAYRKTVCQTANYDGPYMGINVNCSALGNKILKMIKQIDEYKACGDDFPCKSQNKLRVNEIEDGIKQQCRTYLENYNYSDGEKECMDACLNIKETLNEYKKGTDLYDGGTDNSKCGFSGRLITWALNILRWLKYILPVFVIVLGILDFIKAIGSDKDDEMKKAQKRFITRLIAAALVFLIPLIIEFALTKMGFDYNDCGLFK